MLNKLKNLKSNIIYGLYKSFGWLFKILRRVFWIVFIAVFLMGIIPSKIRNNIIGFLPIEIANNLPKNYGESMVIVAIVIVLYLLRKIIVSFGLLFGLLVAIGGPIMALNEPNTSEVYKMSLIAFLMFAIILPIIMVIIFPNTFAPES